MGIILKAHGHCILRSLIDRKGRNRSISFHTRRWRHKGLKKSLWMKSLYGFLHGRLRIMFHDLPNFTLSPLSKGSFDRKSNRPCRVNKWLRVKGPYNYVVMALGLCVKWLSVTPYGFSLFWRVPLVWRLHVLESKVSHVYMDWGFRNVWN